MTRSYMRNLRNTIGTEYYLSIYYIPSSVFSLRSDVPTIADMKIIAHTTMPLATMHELFESMIRHYS